MVRRIAVLKGLLCNNLSSPVHSLCASALVTAAVDVHIQDEPCFICGTAIAFEPHSFDAAVCPSCSVQCERCCQSLQLIHQPEVHNKLLRCSCCKSIAIQNQAAYSLCPYCSVAMYSIE